MFNNNEPNDGDVNKATLSQDDNNENYEFDYSTYRKNLENGYQDGINFLADLEQNSVYQQNLENGRKEVFNMFGQTEEEMFQHQEYDPDFIYNPFEKDSEMAEWVRYGKVRIFSQAMSSPLFVSSLEGEWSLNLRGDVALQPL